MRIKMPAVRIAQADADMPQHQDVLTCGVCQKPFVLGDIVKFIQHKVLACNKENYGCHEPGNNNTMDSGDSDDGVGVVGSRRPSISAPMKKGRVLCSPPPHGEEDPRCSTPKRRPAPAPEPPSPTPIKHNHTNDETKSIKEEVDSIHSSPEEGPSKRLRIDVADAQSNTTNSEPSNYVCSTCKARLHSAWRLVQHVQNSHGIKIYLECSPPGSTSSMGSSPSHTGKNANNHSGSSTCSSSSSSGCSGNANGGPTTPVSLPQRLGLHPPTSSSLVDPHLPLHNPFTVGGLLRMPMEPPRHHQFPPGSLGAAAPASLFARPSSHHEHHFRSVEQLVSEQFRLSQHHGLGLAAAVAAAGGVPPPHSPFGPPPADRPSPVVPTTSSQRTAVPPPPTLPLSLEPQLDFYSQRLRQLAGTTSPGAANGSSSPSPRKLTPPFTSPNSTLQPPVTLAPSLIVSNSNVTTNNNNNNNNTTTANNNNNNITNNNDIRSPTPRPQSSTPPEKHSQMETTPSDSVDLTSTPRSSSTPPNNKPTDFSVNSATTATDGAESRVHSCEYCGKKFRFQSNLVVHRRTHTGEKPFKCSVCNHACSQSSKLRRHMKVHRRKRAAGTNTTEEANSGEGRTSSPPDQMSNEGSVETLDDCDDEDDDDLEDDDEEEEEEEEEDEEEMELEEEGDEDDDLGGDAPEDLTTKSTSSTPHDSGDNKGVSSPKPPGLDKVSSSGSLVGELMDKFGLSNIQQYSEAYKQALQESVGTHNLHISRKDEILQRSHLIPDNNNGGSKHSSPIGRLENGFLDKSAAMRFREEFAKNIMSSQPTLDLVGGPHGLFGPGTPFENPFDASKRLKLDTKDGSHHPLGRGGPGDRDGMYAGLWLPAMAAAHHREQMFGNNGADTHPDLLSSMKADKNQLKNGPNPGTSSSLAAAAAAAALNLGLPGQNIKKENRRNDTCEFCGKVFKNCSNLTVHRRSHTGEKPYKCELCSYACAQSSKLTRHMKTHGRMGKDVYRCRFCEMPFSVPSTLEKHMRKCVVNQNIKAEHILPAMMSGDEDSAASASKDNT